MGQTWSSSGCCNHLSTKSSISKNASYMVTEWPGTVMMNKGDRWQEIAETQRMGRVKREDWRKKVGKANDRNYTAWPLEELQGVAKPYRLMVLARGPTAEQRSQRAMLLAGVVRVAGVGCCCCVEIKMAPAAPCCATGNWNTEFWTLTGAPPAMFLASETFSLKSGSRRLALWAYWSVSQPIILLHSGARERQHSLYLSPWLHKRGQKPWPDH